CRAYSVDAHSRAPSHKKTAGRCLSQETEAAVFEEEDVEQTVKSWKPSLSDRPCVDAYSFRLAKRFPLLISVSKEIKKICLLLPGNP
ncbi:MAG: hypothetical protein ACRERS_03690, partial [Methylococcales bacterium]